MNTLFYQPELQAPVQYSDPFSAELMLDIIYLESLDPDETRMMEHLGMIYLVESKQLAERLGRAIERRTFKEASVVLELLIGATAICNIQSIAPTFRELARAIREGNFAGTKFLYETCALQIERIRKFLRSYISHRPGAARIGVPPVPRSSHP
jgi:hypothetical protein